MDDNKILLLLLPYWTPLIPPMGLACLKSFLQPHGYHVKTVDANTHIPFKKIYDNYFNLLKANIPENVLGNLYNIGHDVLQSHMMAHLNYKDETEYVELVKELMAKHYYCTIHLQAVHQLNRIINEFYSLLETYCLRWLEKVKPAVIGLSVYRGTLPASLFAMKLTRLRDPSIKVIIGGGIFSQELAADSTNLKYFLEKTPFADQIIIGEGENLFLKWLQGKLPPKQRIYSLEDIGQQTLDLSNAEIPDFSDFNPKLYPYMAVYSSRSCPFQCSFCAETTYWGKFRVIKARQVVNQLQELFQRHNHRLFLMCDSLLNPVITDLAQELLHGTISFYWDGYLRIDNQVCDSEKTFLWRRGGFYRARIGIESGSLKVLRLMGKKITLQQVKKALANLAESGIKTTTYWVIGHPGETEEDFQQTLTLLEALKDDIYEAECNPFRYFETGQVNSEQWAKDIQKIPLYSGQSHQLLMLQTWYLDTVPTRKETMQRINRFVTLCQRLGIPNPYSMTEIRQADERWKKLHPNAVPSLVELNSGTVPFDEPKKIKKFLTLQNKFNNETDDFAF